jgi:alkanesulfonate monooxygenase SsuD/methylene tetrahydromethanopterin reductase-like flavin-dependent oxidoreductase (luciferase family)
MPSQKSPVQFGIFDWIEWDKRPAGEIYEQRLKVLEYADEAGFFCYHLAEHHVTPHSLAPSPGLFLSAAAQRTSRIRLGPLVYLLPLYNPLRLLQEICMLDHLSQGRLELGIGRGSSPFELVPYNISADENRHIFLETLDILITGFTHEVLSYEGKYFSYRDVRLWMHPLQQPYPPLWYPTYNRESIPWVAQHGLNTASIFSPSSEARPQFDFYKEVWQQHQSEPDRLNSHVSVPKLGLVRHVYVAPTDRQAEQEARAAFAAWFHNINFLWAQAGSKSLDLLSSFDLLKSNEVIIAGSPLTVQRQVNRAIKETGSNYFCCIFAFGDLSYDQVMASMRLFVQEVMPTIQ